MRRTLEREGPRRARKGSPMRRIARNMLDSVRVRLTVWYSVVLAVVLILVSATTYLIVRKTSMERTDSDLQVLADSFLVTLQAELTDESSAEALGVLPAARQSMLEHRSNSDAFAVLGPSGEIIATSRDDASGSMSRAEAAI